MVRSKNFIRMPSMGMITNKVKLFSSSSVIRSSTIYTLSSFINSALPFFLLPFLTTHLEPSEFGLISMFQVLVNVLYPFISLNLEAAIARKYFEENKIHLKQYLGTCFLLFLVSLFFHSIIFLGFQNIIAKLSNLPIFILKYSVIIAACQFVTTVILTLFQVSVKPLLYGVFQISQSILNFILSICLILYFEKGWVGRVEAQLLAGLFFSFFSIFYLIKKKSVAIQIRKEDILHALNLGLPLIPHALGAMLFTSIDRYIITNEFGLTYTGNYSVAFQIGSVISVFTVAVNNAYIPWLFNKLKLNDFQTKAKVVKYTYFYFIFLIIVALVSLPFFSLIIHFFIGKKYLYLQIFLPYILIGFIFQGMYFMVTNYIIYAKKTIVQALITISLAIIKIPLSYFFVNNFGVIGIGISFSITYLLFFVFSWIASEKVYPMPWNIFKIKIGHAA